ncbi:4-hydroxy-3-polyprenylbenzoate decarboxylase [Anaerolineae bacterium]|nr:4-hydroxy-3-polyprenylbenzoate decarboxylase [Anaerolineae bacterium]
MSFDPNYTDLRSWLAYAEQIGELKQVRGAPLDPSAGQIAEMLHHTDESPAVLMDEFPGYPQGFRILINANGNRKRLALTLGLPLDIGKMELMDAWSREIAELKPVPVNYVTRGPILENVIEGDAVDVTKFPVPLWHEQDGGRYIGTGVPNITRDPDTGFVNLGVYRSMIHDAKRVGCYISPGKHGRVHRDKYFERGEPCPIAMVVGGDLLLFIAGSVELPDDMCEYEWAGAMRGRPYNVIKEKYTGLPIPAEAEIVLTGFIHPTERLKEGPFGEWTGYYASSQRPEPFLEVKAIYHRNDPILLGVPPNKPPYEPHRFRAYLRSALLKRTLEQAGIPDVTGVWCHEVGGCRLLTVVGIKQRYPGHAKQALLIATGARATGYLGRLAIVVDEDIDVTDLDDVMWAVVTRCDPATQVDIIHRAWSGPLDPAIRPGQKGFNSRMLIDACRPYEWKDEFPPAIGPSVDVKRATREKWGFLLK